MKKNLIDLFAAATTVVALTGCGGGGSGGTVAATGNPPPAPSPAPAGRQPVTSVPTPTYLAGSFQLNAFNRINAIRGSVGLGLFTQNAALDGSAQAHAGYVTSNGIGNGHIETAGQAGFTGVNPNDRMVAAAYSTAYTGWAEDMAFTPDGATTVDNLVDAVYHRIPLLQYKIRDIGVGFVQTSTNPNPPSVFDLAFTGTGQGAPALTTVVWPADTSTTTSVSMPSESPRPGTPGASGVFGYPVSISADEDRILSVTTFTLTDSSGTAVLCNLLSYATDPELIALSAKAFIALVPRDPLKPATVYTVQFVGLLDGASYSKSWSFRTP
ncbi:MAG: CAP domain-containing protein [Burkholderiales bacterium]